MRHHMVIAGSAGVFALALAPAAARGSVVLAGHLDSRRYGLGLLVRLRDVELFSRTCPSGAATSPTWSSPPSPPDDRDEKLGRLETPPSGTALCNKRVSGMSGEGNPVIAGPSGLLGPLARTASAVRSCARAAGE